MQDDAQAAEPVTTEQTTTIAAAPGSVSGGQPAAGGQPAGGDQSTAGDQPGRRDSVVTRLMQAGTGEVDALLEALGMREQLSGEAQDIARLIERRLAEIAWGNHEHALDELEIQRAFLVHRFIGPMKDYERMNRGYAVLDNFLNLTSILAGVGASLAAALDAPKAWAIAFGLVVGFLQSISQWLKPAQRSTRRALAAADLRSEAWAFLQRRDRYRGKDDLTAWSLLCDQVERVEGREQAEQDKEAAQIRPAPSPARR